MLEYSNSMHTVSGYNVDVGQAVDVHLYWLYCAFYPATWKYFVIHCVQYASKNLPMNAHSTDLPFPFRFCSPFVPFPFFLPFCSLSISPITQNSARLLSTSDRSTLRFTDHRLQTAFQKVTPATQESHFQSSCSTAECWCARNWWYYKAFLEWEI